MLDHFLLIQFARNTSAQGAFVVCNNSTDTHLSYISAAISRYNYNVQIEKVSDSNKCSILVYDLKSNGLLSDDDSKCTRPSYVLYNQSCIMGCGSGIYKINVHCCSVHDLVATFVI